MEIGGSPSYVRCRNCGKFVATPEVRLQYYCSEDCGVQYSECAVCGRFFKRPAEGNVVYCSSECAAIYEVPISQKIRDLLEEAS